VGMFAQPIAQLIEMVRAWRARARQRALKCALANKAAKNHYHKLNTTFWYLHPPN
jgi:hypothetical protein